MTLDDGSLIGGMSSLGDVETKEYFGYPLRNTITSSDLIELLTQASERGWKPCGIQQEYAAGDRGYIMLKKDDVMTEEELEILRTKFGLGVPYAMISPSGPLDSSRDYKLYEPEINTIRENLRREPKGLIERIFGPRIS